MIKFFYRSKCVVPPQDRMKPVSSERTSSGNVSDASWLSTRSVQGVKIEYDHFVPPCFV